MRRGAIKTDIGDLLDAIDMEWILQREGSTYKVSYGRSGRQLNARECPFCSGAEYKVYINAETGVGNCFSGSCPQGTFSKWTFLSGLLGVERRELVDALKALAREQGWRPKFAASSLTIQDLNSLDLPKGCVETWKMDAMPEYLARRAITPEIAEYFSLYWSESSTWEYLLPDGRQGKQDYSNRIILPIFDMDGSMVSFQGRDTTGTHEQRYLFPPGFASAGAYLYNGCNVVRGTKTVVICEGVFDVIQTKRAVDGAEETKHITPIGTFGMHLSSGNPSGDDQLGRLRKLRHEAGLEEVIFLWDGEQKAFKGAIVAALACVGVGLKAKIAFLEDGKDPGETRPEKIREAILNAMPCNTKMDALKIMSRIRSYKSL